MKNNIKNISNLKLGFIFSFSLHIFIFSFFYFVFLSKKTKFILTELDFSLSERNISTNKIKVVKQNQIIKKMETWGKNKENNTIKNIKEEKENSNTITSTFTFQNLEGGNSFNEESFLELKSNFKGPRWIKNMITSRDYPLMARKNGKDGLVVLKVYIDENGKVVKVFLLSGSYDILNDLAIKKVKEAIFIPAYDANNKPVPCIVNIPIRFKLKN